MIEKESKCKNCFNYQTFTDFLTDHDFQKCSEKKCRFASRKHHKNAMARKLKRLLKEER